MMEKHGLIMVRLDQCQVGLKDKESGKAHQKATIIVTNDCAMAARLSQQCRKDQPHEVLQGSNRYGPRCRQAEDYPEELSKIIATVVMEHPIPEM